MKRGFRMISFIWLPQKLVHQLCWHVLGCSKMAPFSVSSSSLPVWYVSVASPSPSFQALPSATVSPGVKPAPSFSHRPVWTSFQGSTVCLSRNVEIGSCGVVMMSHWTRKTLNQLSEFYVSSFLMSDSPVLMTIYFRAAQFIASASALWCLHVP